MLAVGGHFLGGLGLQNVRLATGFAGGVGDTRQEMCGALSVGILVIGALHGRNSLREDDGPALKLATQYREHFAGEFGTTQCASLYKRVHEPGGLGSCSVLVERAAQILLSLLS